MHTCNVALLCHFAAASLSQSDKAGAQKKCLDGLMLARMTMQEVPVRRCHCGDFLSVKMSYPSSHNHGSMEDERIMLEGYIFH